MAECLDKNIVDKDEYPQTAESRRAACGCSPPWHALDPGDASAGRRRAPARRRCWRAGVRAPLAGAAAGEGKPGRQGQPGEGPNVRRCRRSSRTTSTSRCGRCRWRGWHLLWRRGTVGALRREHDQGRRDAGADVDGLFEAVEGIAAALDRLRRAAGSTSRCTWTARAGRSGAVRRRRSWCGTSACRA